MVNLKVPLEKPEPNFEKFRRVLTGKESAKRVHFVELFMDVPIHQEITEKLLNKTWIPWTEETKEEYWRQDINFWYYLGYDYLRVSGGFSFSGPGDRETEDTAALSKGKRHWVEEKYGMISNWADYENYPWPKFNEIDYTSYEFTSKNLPEGMKMLACPSSGVFEIATETLLGMENLAYLLCDNYPLVEATFNRVGETISHFYENVVEIPNVEGFFQGDDLGFKTSTFLSPDLLRKLVLPWHKRFVEIAHQKNKMYWLHSCGNLSQIMDDLINNVQIDAYHSFQEEIIPVTEFKKRYGERVAVLGGVDVGRLCQSEEKKLRTYVRKILKECMPFRYALGSGNSVANYVPVQNYLIMLDEGTKWQ